jgi:hypothetical protein
VSQNLQLRKALARMCARIVASRPNTRTKVTDEMLDEWTRALSGVPLDALDEATDRIIAQEEYFPVPATVKRYAWDVARDRRLTAESHEPARAEPACLTCRTLTPQWIEAVPVYSQTGVPRIVCRCAITTGHALHPDEWVRLREAQGLPVPPASTRHIAPPRDGRPVAA